MIAQQAKSTFSRRRFVIGSAAIAAGGFALGLNDAFADATTPPEAAEVNVWVVIKPDSTCVIRIARAEMGQGTSTGLAQLVAEELDCDWKKVQIEYPTPGQNAARNRAWGDMGTGGSWGIRKSHDYVRQGGAAARAMLVQAAAQRLNVNVESLSVKDGVVTHAASKRQLSYGELALAASKLTPPDPQSLKLRDPREWKIAGKPLRRLDVASKLDGSKKYTIDFELPGMLHAAVKSCPVFGGKLKSFDERAIRNMRGVRRAIRVDDATVAVVAETWWRAKTALEALRIIWDEGPNAKVSEASLADHISVGLTAAGEFASHSNGAAPDSIGGIAKKVEATYATPFLAHACMEPMSAVGRVADDSAVLWLPTQSPEASFSVLVKETGLKPSQCEIHRMDLGGSFGRRTAGIQDYVRQVVAIAKQFPGTPVKMLWSREEDMTHDYYRPASQAKMGAFIDAKGDLVGLQVRIAGPSVSNQLYPSTVVKGKDFHALQGFGDELGEAQRNYDVPNYRAEFALREVHVPVGTWRGVDTSQNGFYMESFIEEAARAAGRDSIEFRRSMLQNRPKHLGVLDAVAKAARWSEPLPAGRHRGVAVFMGYGSYSAAVSEVSVSEKLEVKIHRLVLALNCGHAVNPHQIAGQVEGATVYGLSAAFFGGMTVENGRIKEDNFDSYRVLRMSEVPKVETIIVPTYDFWGGAGEPPISVVAPSVVNAIFAATGKPIRELPLAKHGFTVAS